MKIEIVSHCWNYSRCLLFQASSLALHPSRDGHETKLTVFYAEEDRRTVDVLDFLANAAMPAGVSVDARCLPIPKLMRRAIGRNLAAVATEADIVWFADCDMLFRESAIDDLVRRVEDRPDGMLYFPRRVLVSQSHEAGDEDIARATALRDFVDVDPSRFRSRLYGRAIGGVQIVRGDVARRRGYVPNSRWQRPRPKWGTTPEDVAFRRALGIPQYGLEIGGVFRLRHSKCGYVDIGCEL